MDKLKVLNAIDETKIIAIVRGTKADDILSIAGALQQGGIRVIEVTCNTPGYLKMIETLAQKMGSTMFIGAGTVLNPIMAQMVVDAGAKFVLAPDLNPAVVTMMHEKQKLVIPGVATPTEMVQAQRLGVDLMKIFPAGALGVRYIKEIRGPLNTAQVMPVGGVTLNNITEFAQAGAFAAGVGGELVDKAAVESKQFNVLTQKAAAFIQAFKDGQAAN